MANQEAVLAKFEDIDFFVSDRPEQKLDVSVFPLDSAAVISQCVLYGGSLVTAGPNTGKSQLLSEVRQIAENALSMPTFSVDINKEAMSAEQLEETAARLGEFATTWGRSGVVLIDHIDTLVDKGDNIGVNSAKRQVKTALFAEDFGPVVIAASQGRQPEISSGFSQEQQYDFKGSIDVIAAQTMLEQGLPGVDAAATVQQLINEDALTYAAVRYIIEEQNDSLAAEVKEAETIQAGERALSKAELRAVRANLWLASVMTERHGPEVAKKFTAL